jgi:uncharacterized repeat protein (TIGR03803 family)
MHDDRSLILKIALLLVLEFLVPIPAAAATEKVLHSFCEVSGCSVQPAGGLISDQAGNFYGTTTRGGEYGFYYGTVFELFPSTDGKWTEKILHSFGRGTDGQSPEAGLVFDAAGNLYGTTGAGGTNTICDSGCGTVFELTPSTGGKWTEEVLHNFDENGKDGWDPTGGLILDAAGNLYGTAEYGGVNNYGVVFELAPDAHGTWTEKILHNFRGEDGAAPSGSLIFDASGDLYGTTSGGGTYSGGTVFELMAGSTGAWTEKVLHYFGKGADGSQPTGGVVFNAAGQMFGTTTYRGAYTYGAVFQLTPTVGGKWIEEILHSFNNNGHDGNTLWAATPILDGAGNLYCTTLWGGVYNDGTVFELIPDADGKWTEKILHDFGRGSDGSEALGSLVFDSAGTLYGATYGGGKHCQGTVFQITP